MGVFKKIGKGVSYFFDFRIDRWLNLKMLKETTHYFVTQTKAILKVEHAEKTENFDDAVERLQLSSDFIETQSKRYLYLALVFLLFAILLFLYGLYILMQGNYMGGCTCFALFLYTLSCAFRFHFWHFQMQQKKLGCGLKDWLKSI